MPGPYDAALKQLLDARGPDWVGWLARLVGLPAGVAADPLDPDLSVVQPVADKVFRLRPPELGLLHLEAQSSWDGDLPGRLLLYNVLLEDRYGGPVHTVALLLRRDANAPDLTGEVVRADATGREYLRFTYGVIRLWRLPADDLIGAGLGMMPLALLTDDAAPRLQELVDRLADAAVRELPEQNAREVVLSCGFQLLGMRYNADVIRRLLAGLQNMVDLRESSFFQVLREDARAEGLQQGRTEGLQQGLQQGRNEGLQQGRAEFAREALLGQLQEKFGAVPPAVEARVRAATDPDRLAAALRQVLRITSPDELVL